MVKADEVTAVVRQLYLRDTLPNLYFAKYGIPSSSKSNSSLKTVSHFIERHHTKYLQKKREDVM